MNKHNEIGSTDDVNTVTEAELATIDGGNILVSIGIAVLFEVVNRWDECVHEFKEGMAAAMQ